MYRREIFCIIIIFSSQILVQNTIAIVLTFYFINKTINKELNNLEHYWKLFVQKNVTAWDFKNFNVGCQALM